MKKEVLIDIYSPTPNIWIWKLTAIKTLFKKEIKETNTIVTTSSYPNLC